MNFEEILKSSSCIFSNYYVIDIINDKVLEYDNNFKLLTELSFNNYIENMKKVIHIDDINTYFDSISLQKITSELEKGNYIINCHYKKLLYNNYKDYSCFIKLIEKDNNKYILLFETQSFQNSSLNNNDSNKEIENINYITDRVSDIIFKIFNTINIIDDKTEIYQINNALDYITNILNNLVKDVPELTKGLENQMILEVNKNKPSLLIVDDDIMTRNLIKKAFVDEYEIIMATNGQEALDILERNNSKNNIEIRDNIVGIFLDLAMPVLDGFAVLDYLKLNNILNKVPVVVISAAEEKNTRQRVYQYGIADMIEKPFNLEIIKYRTNNLINLYKTSNSLDELISKKNNDLSILLQTVLNSYLCDNELKINYVTKISNYFLNKLVIDYPDTRLNTENIMNILEAIKYYDIGTYFLPRNVDKNSEEYLKHCDIGSEFIEIYFKSNLDKDVYNYAINIAKYHHDKYDGSGIHKINGDNIPIYVQIVSLAIQCSEMYINKKSLNDLYNAIIIEKEKKYNSIIINIFEKYYGNIFN